MKSKTFLESVKKLEKYPSEGKWFSAYNDENGFYGTLDACLDYIEHSFTEHKYIFATLWLSDADDNDPDVKLLKNTIIEQEKETIKKVRQQIRKKCLKDGEAESDNESGWYISFRGKN